MKRRTFLHSAAAISLGVPFGGTAKANAPNLPTAQSSDGSFSVDDNRVRFYSAAVTKPLKIMVITDTHLFIDDDRGEPYRQFSGRMASAYNKTRHFRTGKPTNPEESFAQVLQLAQDSKVDLLAMTGDIFSFPSEAAIEWVRGKLADAAVPFLYVSGNHDWHYEGMDGSRDTLRATWIEKRLKPLYQGKHPLMAAYDIKGIRFLAIDNSTYEILPEQLDFFRFHVSSGKPLVLLVHIPLYAPGRPIGFGCGHPAWGAKTDRNHEVERRTKWPESGHTPVTLNFHREVFAAPNLLGIFAGHTHQRSIDVVNGTPQFVTDANAGGAFTEVEFYP